MRWFKLCYFTRDMNFSGEIKRICKSLIGLDKNYALSFRNFTDRLSYAAALAMFLK